MRANRIKWDEAMLIRCLARVADYDAVPVVVKKKEAAKVEENDFLLEFDISASDIKPEKESKRPKAAKKADNYIFSWNKPIVSDETDANDMQTNSGWEEFIMSVDMAL